MPNPDGTLTQAEIDALLNGGDGKGAAPTLGLKDFEGSPVIIQTPEGPVSGKFQWVRQFANDQPGQELSGWRFVSDNGYFAPVTPGLSWLTNTGTAYTVGSQGTVIDQRDLSGSALNQFAGGGGGASGASGGGGGGGGISGSYYIPNAIDILNAQLKVYEDMAAQGAIPHKDAVDAFNAFAQQVQNTIQAQSQQGQFQQNAAIYGNQAQNDYNTLQQRIAEAQTNRAQNIQSELTNRQNTLANSILPFSVEGNYSLNLPLIGNVPMTHINPNQFFDIAGLNNIPQPVTTPTAPQAIPVPTVTAPGPGEYPAIPNTQLPNFDLSALLRAAGIAA